MQEPQHMLYAVQRWPLGWVVVGYSSAGIPLNALSEIQDLFPTDSVIDPGIAHHLRYAKQILAVFVVAQLHDSTLWRQQIAEEIKARPEEGQYGLEREWWNGTDVGKSSAVIFSTLCTNSPFKQEAKHFGNGEYPHDPDDFGRCRRLLEKFPEWKPLLPKVAQAYPDSKWPEIIESWDLVSQSTQNI